MQNKWKCIKDAFGIIYWWLPLQRVGLPPQHSEGRIDFDREKESEFAPLPPPLFAMKRLVAALTVEALPRNHLIPEDYGEGGGVGGGGS